MKTFFINFGISFRGKSYRAALLNFYYPGIENTTLWNRGWRKLFWKIYVNKTPILTPLDI